MEKKYMAKGGGAGFLIPFINYTSMALCVVLLVG